MSDEEKPKQDSEDQKTAGKTDLKEESAKVEEGAEKPPVKAEEGAEKSPIKDKPAPSPKIKKKIPSYEDVDDDPVFQKLNEKVAVSILSVQKFLDQSICTVSLDGLYELMVDLRDNSDLDFNYLVDVTALDYLGDEQRFCLVYQLYSYKLGRLIRIKTRAAEGEVVPSVSSIWKTADWLEREVYDLFGIEFSGHPDLRRILLPDDWHGYPLRKDYDIKLQDQAWISSHLKIRKTPA